MEGNTEKVPVVTPEYQQHFFQLGRILSHRYMLTGYFPLCLSQAFIAELVDPSTTVSDAVLYSHSCITLMTLKRRQLRDALPELRAVVIC